MDVATKIAEKFCQLVEKNVKVFTILLIMCGVKDVFVLCMQSGRSLLHFAAELDHHEAVECLLEKKADADAKDKVNNITDIFTY